MASASIVVERAYAPHLTAEFVEPYLRCHLRDGFETTAINGFPQYSITSLQTAVQSLRKHKESLQANNAVAPFRWNGFVSTDEFYTPILGGNGLFTILMSFYPGEKENHEISIIDHASNEVTHLGYFPTYGLSKNKDQFCCCPREPRVLCGLTQNGNNFALLGPRDYTSSTFSPIKDTPVFAVFQLSPDPIRLFKKRFKNAAFLKCDPISIALSPPSVAQASYTVAIVTKKMAVMLLNVVTLERSTINLVFVSPEFYMDCVRNPQENCVMFSPDGRLLSLMCFLTQQSTSACLILDVHNLEPICWIATTGALSFLRWLFPIFSTCGTKLILPTFPDREDFNDERKYELIFYKIKAIRSLKELCRVIILECVMPGLLNQLPLPENLLLFLGAGGTRTVTVNSPKSSPSEESDSLCSDNTKLCKCSLL